MKVKKMQIVKITLLIIILAEEIKRGYPKKKSNYISGIRMNLDAKENCITYQ